MTEDPLQSLLGELLDAHDRLLGAHARLLGAQAPLLGAHDRPLSVQDRPHAGALWRRRRRRTFALLSACVLAVCASATAAVLIATQNSAPLVGRLPQLLGSRYAVQVTPDLRAGHVGWCVALLDLGAGDTLMPIPDGCVGGRGPLIAGGGLVVLNPHSGRVRSWLLYAIVSQGVAALQSPDGARIRPISSRGLPSGWRAAVTIESHSITLNRSTVVTLTPLGANGRKLSTRRAAPLSLPTRRVSANHSRAGACTVHVESASGVRVGGARTLAGALPRSPVAGAGFLVCYSGKLSLDGDPSVTSVLVSARRPGGRPGDIPGLRPLRDDPRILAGPAKATGPQGSPERLFARRVRHGWLVLETPAPAAAALRLLRRTSAYG